MLLTLNEYLQNKSKRLIKEAKPMTQNASCVQVGLLLFEIYNKCVISESVSPLQCLQSVEVVDYTTVLQIVKR